MSPYTCISSLCSFTVLYVFKKLSAASVLNKEIGIAFWEQLSFAGNESCCRQVLYIK